MKSVLSGRQQSRSARAARAAPSSDVAQFAVLKLGTEVYALDIMRIRGIIKPVRITPVPKAPPFIEGVIELRGAILPMLDMRKRFDLEAPGPTRATRYVLVSLEGRIMGMIVDGVVEVIRIPRVELKPTPAMAVGEAARYFSGVCHHQDRLIMVIDIDEILSSSEKISLSGIGSVTG
ncbi:MAG TPA: chemotaxis protein CheW [Polyangia bacterium]|jgi:purine-binding chemotaxis protein CheW|nr:chemotaxis protein CheW [Polyangia bacterium]